MIVISLKYDKSFNECLKKLKTEEIERSEKWKKIYGKTKMQHGGELKTKTREKKMKC